MVELLTTLSLTQVFVFIFVILVAAKELITVIDFFRKKIKGAYNSEASKQDLMESIHEKLIVFEKDMEKQKEQNITIHEKLMFLEEDTKERKAKEQESYEKSAAFHQCCEERLNGQQKILEMLTESDRDDIRSWVVQQYHFFCEQKKWIDDFSMDALEKRYAHYVQEGGNSYITSLMDQIRALPRRPE